MGKDAAIIGWGDLQSGNDQYYLISKYEMEAYSRFIAITSILNIILGGNSSNVLQQATVQINTKAECNAQYEGGIFNQHICASAPGKDTCQVNSLNFKQSSKSYKLLKRSFIYYV